MEMLTCYKQPYRKHYLTTLFAAMSIFTFAQTYQRQTNESAEVFLKRVLKADELAHPAIETKEWYSAKKVLFAFINDNITSFISKDRPDPDEDVIGYVFIPIGSNQYQRELIDTFKEEGAMAHIETAFFVNADTDEEREIAVMVSWRQLHKGLSTDGYLYDTYLYENPNPHLLSDKLIRLKHFDYKFSCEEGSFDGKEKKAKYKSASSIRIALKQMGY